MDAKEFKSSFNRPNLYYEVRQKTKDIDRQIIKFIKQHHGKSGIIYCISRKKVEELAAVLKANDIKAAPYHAGLDSATRSKTQDDFLMERIDVIVATIAFGMGIDKPDVRFVIHYDIPKSLEAYYQAVERAFMISADNAHAWHPNYSEKFDPTNHPMLGGGPVIKFNAAQKYASDAVSAAIFANICEAAGVPCQRFVNHSDVAGGSTLGNILASSIPLKGVDMGNAILAMHSCRETGSVIDHEYCVKAFTKFYQL